jgi:hypothetical protein
MDEVIDWLNYKRLHSTLGYVSPMTFAQRWKAAQQEDRIMDSLRSPENRGNVIFVDRATVHRWAIKVLPVLGLFVGRGLFWKRLSNRIMTSHALDAGLPKYSTTPLRIVNMALTQTPILHDQVGSVFACRFKGAL